MSEEGMSEEDIYNSWPAFKLQAECKRWGLGTTGDKPELVTKLLARHYARRGYPAPSTPDFQAFAPDPNTYLSNKGYELQELCNERKLPHDRANESKHILIARLLEDDRKRWILANEENHTADSDPDCKKRRAYQEALAEFTILQCGVKKQAVKKYYDDWAFKIENEIAGTSDKLHANLEKLDRIAAVQKKEKLKDSSSQGTTAEARLDADAESVLGLDHDFEELTEDHSWAEANKNRKDPNSRRSRHVEDEEAPETDSAPTSGSHGAAAAAKDPSVLNMNNLSTANSELETSVITTSTTSTTSKTEALSNTKLKGAAPNPYPAKKARPTSQDLSDKALLNVPDPYAHLVAPHPKPVLERIPYFEVSAFISISPEVMSVRGDRVLAIKDQLGDLNLSGTQMKIEVLADPTAGTFIFYLNGADKLGLIRDYWEKKGNTLVIFGKEIKVYPFDGTAVMMAEISRANKEREAQKLKEDCAKVLAEVHKGEKPTIPPPSMPSECIVSKSCLKESLMSHNYIGINSKDQPDKPGGYTKSLDDVEILWSKVWFMPPLYIQGDPEMYAIVFDDTDEGDRRMKEAMSLCFRNGWRSINKGRFFIHSRPTQLD